MTPDLAADWRTARSAADGCQLDDPSVSCVNCAYESIAYIAALVATVPSTAHVSVSRMLRDRDVCKYGSRIDIDHCYCTNLHIPEHV